MESAALQKEILGCTKCPLYVEMPFGPLISKDTVADYLVILEKPSRDDSLVQEIGYDFLGTLLHKLMSAAGYERSEYYVTSLLKCHTEKVLQKYVSKCFPFLEREREIVKPKATFVFTQAHSTFLKKHNFHATILPSLFYLYNRGFSEYGKVVAELKKVKHVIQKESSPR